MLALGLWGGRVMLVDEATGEEKWAVQAHAAGYSRKIVAMSPSGRFVASVASSEENWKLWDAASGAVWIAGARHDGTGACICEWDDQGRRLLQEGCPVVAHTAGISALAFSPCGQRLASGGLDGAVILWDAQTGEAERRMERGSGAVCWLGFSADGARLASGSWDGTIHVWDAATWALLRTLHVACGDLLSVHFSPTNSGRVASASFASGGHDRVRLWDVGSGEIIRSFAGSQFVAFSQDGHTIATGRAATGDVELINAESGELRLRLVSHQTQVLAAAFSLDGSKLATVSLDYTCKVWDSSTGALLRTIEVGQILFSVAWGRDWARDTQTGVAFAMGHHPRLGERSRVQALDAGVVRMILDRV